MSESTSFRMCTNVRKLVNGVGDTNAIMKQWKLLRLACGDITSNEWKVDAIANAANERMLGGGGVDGAIHRAAGVQLVEACRRVPEVSKNVRCPTGHARITGAFNLPCKYVIHTVGPIYSVREKEKSATLLASAYTSSLSLAHDNGIRRIAFPAISCGVYRFPLREAAKISITECIKFVESQGDNTDIEEISFILFSSEVYDVFLSEAIKMTELQQL